jgi:hypothetical protein
VLTAIQLGREFSILLIVLCIDRLSVGELQCSLVSFGSKFSNMHLNRLDFCHLSKKLIITHYHIKVCRDTHTKKKSDILILVQEAIHISEW